MVQVWSKSIQYAVIKKLKEKTHLHKMKPENDILLFMSQQKT